MAKKRHAVDPALIARAKATSWLATQPEAQTLTQLLRGAAADFGAQVAVERGAARGVANTANAAIPKVRSYFKQADKTRKSAQTYVDRRLSGLSPIADDIKAGSAAEAAGFMRRLGETRAATLGEFQSRKVDAKAGAAFAVRAARDQYRSDSGKIKGQLLALKRRKGVITTVALNDAIKAEEQAAQARRTENRLLAGQHETARHNRVTEQQGNRRLRQQKQKERRAQKEKDAKLATSVLAGAAPDRPTRTQRVAARDHYGAALIAARNNAQHWLAGGTDKKGNPIPPASRAEIIELLTPKAGGSTLLARAALQTALDGGVHHKTRAHAKRRYGITLPREPKISRVFTP